MMYQLPALQFPGADSVVLFGVLALALFLFGFVLLVARRYKRCPSNKILVIYGKTTKGRSARTLHGGGSFVWPLIQNYEFLSLDPMQIEIPLEGALSIENIRVSVPSVFTVAIGTDEESTSNAAIRLLGLKAPEIIKQAEDIIFGQLRQVIASMRIEEINRDRDIFLASVQSSLEPELRKIGLVLINVNIKDITDESGYIEAIGRKAASTAIQQAEVDVAVQEKSGAIGVAEAVREKAVTVASAVKEQAIGTKLAEQLQAVRLAELDRAKIVGEKTEAYAQEAQVREQEQAMRIRVADANATAVEGENEAKVKIAQTNSLLAIQEAEAYQRAESRKREAAAAVREAQYLAEAKAAEAQAKKIEAEKRAELESVANAEKAQTIVAAEAYSQRKQIEAEGEASALFARYEARARGEYEMLAKKADGLRQIVSACGGHQGAFQMLMLEKIEELSKNAASAISNIKFDKVVVWDGGQGGKDGQNSTSKFLRGLAGSLPPMMEMMRDIGGVEMPEFFGKLVDEQAPQAAPASTEAVLPEADSEAAETEAKPAPQKKKPSSDKG